MCEHGASSQKLEVCVSCNKMVFQRIWILTKIGGIGNENVVSNMDWIGNENVVSNMNSEKLIELETKMLCIYISKYTLYINSEKLMEWEMKILSLYVGFGPLKMLFWYIWLS